MLNSDNLETQNIFLEEEANLHNQIDALNKEIIRKSYIATGLLAIIFDAKVDLLIQKATNIINTADAVD